MSEYWDLHCETCDSRFGVDVKSGNDALRVLWDNRLALISIHRQSYGRVDICVDYNISVDHDWLQQHVDHDVRVKSEYGYYDTDCGEIDACSCGTRGWCRLKMNHDGQHGCIHMLLGTGPHAEMDNQTTLSVR